MADPINVVNAGSESFMTVVFPIASFIISISVAASFFISDKIKESRHQKQVKNIISGNVKQLTKICDRLYVDVDEIEGNTEADMTKARQISEYFERNFTRLEMIRINIENHITQINEDKKYVDSIKKILENEDSIIETCNRPDIPVQYKLSLWKENQSSLQEKTKKVIDIAKNLKIIQQSTI